MRVGGQRIQGASASASASAPFDAKVHHHHLLDPNAPPTLPRRPPRPALQLRDSNAKMRVPPKAPVAGKNASANSTTASMSYDKKNLGSRPPLAPALSPSARSPAVKTPLKPRLAASAQPASTPSTQRKARGELSTPASVSVNGNAISTPVAAFLNNNVTPRSGPRKTRVDSAGSTPQSTPIGTPAPPATAKSPVAARSHGPGLRILGLDKDTPTGKMLSYSPSLQDSGYARSPALSSAGDSKFFYASEVKPTSSPADSKFFFASEAPAKAKLSTSQTLQQLPARPTLRKKTSNSSFCYASGESVPDVPFTTGSAVGSMVGGDRSHRRLFNTKGITNANSTAASAIGSMVGGERSHHRPFHVRGESHSSHYSPSIHGSMAGSMVGEDRPHHKLFHSDGRPRGSGASAVGSMVGSLVGSIVGSERSHTQFFHANGEPDEPDSPVGSAIGSMIGSAYGEDRPRPKFFHANDVVPRSTHGSTAGSTVGDDASHPKFFHANGTPDAHSSTTPRFTAAKTSRASSTVSSSSRMASPRISTGRGGPKSPTPKVTSSPKLDQPGSQMKGSVRVKPSLPSPGAPRPLPGRGQSANSMVAPRRASIELAHRVVNHTRSISFDSKPETRTPPTRKYSGASQYDYPSSPLNLITHPVPISTPEEASEGELPNSDAPLEIASPLRTGQSIETLNELAAKARRERKVLDLEITNSSLEAINRTLEREMRKQTAELRRYRRLSRSGRLSITTTLPLRSSSGLISVMEGEDEPHSTDPSEIEDNVSENDESEFSDEEELSEEGSLSPRAIAESDAKHRFKDEKRLQLDLSKHQQLLVDSQKINQSLKRCLGWTEELIIEGKKALAYHVKPSDVSLGGRVLALDEVEGNMDPLDDDEMVDNEGMSAIGAQMLREARKAAKENAAFNSRSLGPAKDDRDSGVELDGSQNNDSLSYQS